MSELIELIWTRIDPDGPGLHFPQREGDIGWDLEAAESVALAPHEQYDISTNVRVQLPKDCWGEIRARSSIARRGLQAEAGIIDNGYSGPLLVLLRNMKDTYGHVGKGHRIAQLVLHRAVWAVSREVAQLADDPRRGVLGFGSTGR